MSFKILAINPGSTSTKIAIFEDETEKFVKNIKHSAEEIAKFDNVASQFQFRKDIILSELKDAGFNINEINAIVGRGGLVKPIESGVYEVNEALINDLNNPPLGEHASNLGGLIANDIAKSLNNGTKAYIADPVVVDELQDVARLTGHPDFTRVSIFHALNQNINLIIAHLGGGVSVGAHDHGRVIDVNNALDGDGPFSPERSGSLPTGQLVKLCFSGKKTEAEIKKMLKGAGGLVAYLGTNDAYEVEIKAKEDPKYKLVQDAMSYQVGKAIGEMAAVLKGKVDGILLTGGIAHNPFLVDYVKEMVGFIAPIKVYAGEDEMRALAMNGLMVLRGELSGKIYK